MKHLKLLILPLLITLACLLLGWYKPTAATAPTTFAGKVTYVYDGDTLTVLDNQYNQHIIRLASIDAPEKDQPYGRYDLDKPYFETHMNLENLARQEKLGLWADGKPTPPWLWRRKNKA